MPETYHKLFRCEVYQHYEGQQMMNVFHAVTVDPTTLASAVATTLSGTLLPSLMKLQNFNVTYERLIAYCLNPEFPHMYDLDLEATHPQTDVINLPSIIAWKWTARNITPHRSFIGGFYLGGLRSIDFFQNGQISGGGLDAARIVRDEIMAAVGVGGNTLVRCGTYSRTYGKKFPQTPIMQLFVPWTSLNFNYRYTSMRKRLNGVGL